MNWDALGAIGEVVGAAAVVATLVFLAIQVRHSTRSMDESNRLQRTAAIDRHTDSMSRWRGTIAENADIARIWFAAVNDNPLTDEELIRLNNMYINLINTQRSNYERALVVGEQGLAEQAAKSIAFECYGSKELVYQWERTTAWNRLACPEFVEQVELEFVKIESQGKGEFFAANRAMRKSGEDLPQTNSSDT